MVITKVRAVEYFEMATNHKGLSHPHHTIGYEPVEERPYCLQHAASAPPPEWLERKRINSAKRIRCEWTAQY